MHAYVANYAHILWFPLLFPSLIRLFLVLDANHFDKIFGTRMRANIGNSINAIIGRIYMLPR